MHGRSSSRVLPFFRRAIGAIACVALLALPSSAAAQAPGLGGDGWRVGMTLGGISTFGISFEVFRDSRSVDVTLGTFGFRDLGVYVGGRQYFFERAARPFVGLGLWGIVSWTAPRNGYALVARAPLGVDWNFTHGHAVGAEIGVSRALAIRRPEPDDDRELNKRLVPLPGIYYRWAP